ncbi:uncharacterized protein CC84DRAFT_363638 [Paraphaeosphaeria sporulosa]|uniref:Uncharacterized protein n=1 Tax=Paraphaeosphaeria sporulosa TaxID=1460663 RepID=A0A177C0I2_9PLEO|nr:uncharacterized protein CC84DRAFT_363638 [Paraphaeosphaeria sporulosa]OAG00217.1 hypothetical protein CC84DRAFT_363638 [Paraphaeosphaeria sporulosa]
MWSGWSPEPKGPISNWTMGEVVQAKALSVWLPRYVGCPSRLLVSSMQSDIAQPLCGHTRPWYVVHCRRGRQQYLVYMTPKHVHTSNSQALDSSSSPAALSLRIVSSSFPHSKQSSKHSAAQPKDNLGAINTLPMALTHRPTTVHTSQCNCRIRTQSLSPNSSPYRIRSPACTPLYRKCTSAAHKRDITCAVAELLCTAQPHLPCLSNQNAIFCRPSRQAQP